MHRRLEDAEQHLSLVSSRARRRRRRRQGRRVDSHLAQPRSTESAVRAHAPSPVREPGGQGLLPPPRTTRGESRAREMCFRWRWGKWWTCLPIGRGGRIGVQRRRRGRTTLPLRRLPRLWLPRLRRLRLLLLQQEWRRMCRWLNPSLNRKKKPSNSLPLLSPLSLSEALWRSHPRPSAVAAFFLQLCIRIHVFSSTS